ncbi:MAG: type II toxin-antitoxin system VapC family toxin [Armatimonadetes bacterium]|nr:type II toxin-antitoxin system VapC family toxin [Armatimonadota bacterium]
MYLLDTNACIDVLAGNQKVDEHLARLDRVRVYTSAVVIGELVYGAVRSRQPIVEMAKIRQLMQDARVLHVDSSAAFQYGLIKAALAAQGRLLEDNDLFIAATALAKGLTLVTHDKAFARIPDLAIEDWLEY